MIGRRQEPPYRDRRVRVRATLTRAAAVYEIEDDGPGFDVSRLPDPTDPANLERVGGRGLMLIRAFMDAVEHLRTRRGIRSEDGVHRRRMQAEKSGASPHCRARPSTRQRARVFSNDASVSISPSRYASRSE
jgi:hypothetical protein